MALSTTFTQYAPESTKFCKITQNKGHFTGLIYYLTCYFAPFARYSPDEGVSLERSPWNFQWMSMDGQGTKWRKILRKISTGWVVCTNVTDDRQTGDSIRLLETSAVDIKLLPSFNWAKIHLLRLQQQPGPTNQEPGPKWRIIWGAGAGPRWARLTLTIAIKWSKCNKK